MSSMMGAVEQVRQEHKWGQQLEMYLALDSGTRRGSENEGEGGKEWETGKGIESVTYL